MDACLSSLWCLKLPNAAVRASAGAVRGPGASTNDHLGALLSLCAHGKPWKRPQHTEPFLII